MTASDIIRVYARDVGVDPPVDGFTMLQPLLASLGGAVAWVPVTIPTDQASWDVANAVGTWDFSTPGEIAQTDSTQTEAYIATLAAIALNTDAAVQIDARVDVVDGGGNAAFAAMVGFDPAFIAGDWPDESLSGIAFIPGDPTTPLAVGISNTYGHITGGSTTAGVGSFHTYAKIGPYGLVDGVVAMEGGTAVGAQQLDLRVLTLKADGAVTFRNPKVSVLPAPTL